MKFPCVIKKGSAHVTIYRTPVKAKGKVYEAFTVRYYADGKPCQKKFGSISDAEKHAKTAADRINAGTILPLTLTDYEIGQFREASALLAGRVSMIDAARFWVARNAIQSRTVSDATREMIDQKIKDGSAETNTETLAILLGKFCVTFGSRPISDVTGLEIDAWLRALTVAPRSRNNYRSAIRTLCNWSRGRQYLPRDWFEFDSVVKAKEQTLKITLYTPEELKRLFTRVTPPQLILLALGAFAGLRSAEIARQRWEDIGPESLRVTGAKGNTASRRLVPILPALAGLLEPRRKPHGLVLDGIRRTDAIQEEIERKSGVAWQRNGLRHSWISYRLALVKSADQVALEAGNSPRKIFSNYRELVTETAANEWFAFDSSGIFTKPSQIHRRK